MKRLGEPAVELDYPRERRNFAGDCVFFLQRHFVDCMLSGEEFESSGRDYLKTIEVVEAAYESAALASSQPLSRRATLTRVSRGFRCVSFRLRCSPATASAARSWRRAWRCSTRSPREPAGSGCALEPYEAGAELYRDTGVALPEDALRRGGARRRDPARRDGTARRALSRRHRGRAAARFPRALRALRRRAADPRACRARRRRWPIRARAQIDCVLVRESTEGCSRPAS